jgi:hypothetical protein
VKRPLDIITLSTPLGTCQLFKNVEVSQDFHEVANLTIGLGDDGSWDKISKIVHPGRPAQLSLNGRLQFTGRFEENESEGEARSGAEAHLVCRTKMSDAHYASADPATKYSDVSIGTFLITLFAPLGYTKKDFLLDADADANLMTGERIGKKPPVDLEPLLEGKAKVQPGETILDCATRHVKRHHLFMWDAADGRIAVGRANDTQAPTFRFICKRGARSDGNNILGFKRIVDWSETPSEVHVFGSTPGDDDDPIPIIGKAVSPDLASAGSGPEGFHRILRIPIEGLRTTGKAQAQAVRELANRSKRVDGWEVRADGWTQWQSPKSVPFALNTTADVDIDAIGTSGAGRYLIYRVVRKLGSKDSSSTRLWLVRPGIFVA